MPEVGLGERGGVVHPVADHGHAPAGGLQPLHLGDLALGQHPGDHLVDADRRGHLIGRGLVVAGEQDRVQTQVAESAYGFGGGGFDGVGHRDDPPGRAVPADQDRRTTPALLLRVRPAHLGPHDQTFGLEELHAAPPTPTCQTWSRSERTEALTTRRADPARVGR